VRIAAAFCRSVLIVLVLATGTAFAQSAQDADLNWVFASRGHIPKTSLVAGREANGDSLYACRARLANGAETPGKIRQPLVGCSVAFGGLEWTLAAYQVLHDGGPKTIRWVPATQVPQRAYKVGREPDGTVLYLCRAKHVDGSIQIGRVASRDCVYGFAGKQEQSAEFEVLVKP